MQVTYKVNNPNPGANENSSSLFGILEGKQKAAAAAAKIAVEKAQQDTLLLKLEAARQGYNPEAAAQQTQIATAEVGAKSEMTLYIILAVVVVVVMVGIYFIRKK